MAILKRRKPQRLSKKFQEALWPSQGWQRTFHYYRHRIFRTGDSTYKITAGLATGAAVSWTPFFGTHFIQAIFFSWLIRASMLAGFIGTAWGNPWTFAFMFWIGYQLGVQICGLFGLSEFVAIPETFNLEHFIAHPWEFFSYLWQHPVKLLLPITIGGYLCGLLFWPVAYALLYYPVRSARTAYRLQRIKRRKKKLEKLQQQARLQ